IDDLVTGHKVPERNAYRVNSTGLRTSRLRPGESVRIPSTQNDDSGSDSDDDSNAEEIHPQPGEKVERRATAPITGSRVAGPDTRVELQAPYALRTINGWRSSDAPRHINEWQ